MISEFFREQFDYKTLLITFALIAIGIISIYSATFEQAPASMYYQRQLMWFGVGFFALLVTMFIPFRLLQQLAFVAYGGSLVLLVMVLIIGKTVAGSQSWLGVGNYGQQPSELAKVGTILALAAYIARRDVDLTKVKHIAITAAILFIPVVLILLQPDAGTALTYCGMFVPILAWGGAPMFLIFFLVSCAIIAVTALFGTTAMIIAFIIIAIAIYFFRQERFLSVLAFAGIALLGTTVQFMIGRLHPYQQKRLLVYLNPDADPLGAGYNVFQSKVAIGSGGFFGKGFLHGTQTQFSFIPEQWTDFIFCVPGEEFGFIGSFVLLLLFMTLLLRSVRLSGLVKNSFGSLVVIGVASIFLVHIIINVGMAMGLVPVAGVPLPFLSYGGSALLANMTMIGLLMNVYAHRKEY